MTKKTKRLLLSILCFTLILGYAIWYTYYAKPEQKEKIDSLTQTEQTASSKSEENVQNTDTTDSQNDKSSKKSSKSKKSGKAEYSSKECDTGYAENNPLYFGNPSDAKTDLSLMNNYMMIKPQYTLSYNASTFNPNWVAWHLCKDDLGDADRSDDFRPDKELPIGWYAIKKKDYQYKDYGFDRGHICPSADRTKTKEDNSMTFLMTIMVPQTPDNNRVIWMHFENYERELVRQGYEVYLIAGPYGKGGTGAKGTFESIPVELKTGETIEMVVPSYTWKVLIAIPAGTDDLERVDSTATAIAINVPNQTGMQKTGDWEQFLCSIDDIEEMTGYDFFELLPDNVEDVLEKAVYVP